MKLTVYLNGKGTTIIISNCFTTHCYALYRSNDFRPMYSRLHEIRALIASTVPFLACSATVTPTIRQDCIEKLGMCGCKFVSISPDRPNI